VYVIAREGEFKVWRRSGADFRFNGIVLQIDEEIVIDRYMVPLMQHDGTLAQILELVVAEGDGRC